MQTSTSRYSVQLHYITVS